MTDDTTPAEAVPDLSPDDRIRLTSAASRAGNEAATDRMHADTSGKAASSEAEEWGMALGDFERSAYTRHLLVTAGLPADWESRVQGESPADIAEDVLKLYEALEAAREAYGKPPTPDLRSTAGQYRVGPPVDPDPIRTLRHTPGSTTKGDNLRL